MDTKYSFAIFVAFITTAAATAMVKWQFDFIVEIILCISIFCAITTGLWIIVGWLYTRENATTRRRACYLLFSGSLIGAYICVAIIYFTGHLADTYPKSQKLINDQEKSITQLSGDLSTLNGKVDLLNRQLTDARKALADPLTVSKPSYELETSLRLQFNRSGNAKEIEAHNLVWTAIDFKESEEHEAVASAPASMPTQQETTTASSLGLSLVSPQPLPLECSRMVCPPQGPTYTVTLARMIVLSFLRPVAASDISFDPYGADLPKHSVLSLNERSAIVWFESAPKSVVLNIQVKQQKD